MTKTTPTKCDPFDIALKAHFLGPQAENLDFLELMLQETLRHWSEWRSSHFSSDGEGISQGDKSENSFRQNQDQIKRNLGKLMNLYEKEIPMYSPHYIGHMASENSLPSIVGHFLALLHNPNNVTRDASAAGLIVERDSVEMLAQMLRFEKPDQVRGHFTSGGTVANFEALLRALKRQMSWIYSSAAGESLQKSAHSGWRIPRQAPSVDSSLIELQEFVRSRWGESWKPKVFVPMSAHYSWEKAVSLLGLGKDALVYVPLNRHGQTDVHMLGELMRTELDKGSTLLAVVSLAGSTEMGTIDALDLIQVLLDEWREQFGLHLWHHIDAAYGGFFAACPTEIAEWGQSLLDGFKGAQSVTIDPHKLGYVPYSAGVVLVRESQDYELFDPGAPYLEADHGWPGAQTLEGSRSATGATAFWMMAKCMGLDSQGLGRLLSRSLKLKGMFHEVLARDSRFLLLPGCNSNLSLFSLCSSEVFEIRKLSRMNKWVAKIMKKSQVGDLDYRFSMTIFELCDHSWLRAFLEGSNIEIDCDKFYALRLVFMNPFIESRESHVNHIEAMHDKLRQLLSSEFEAEMI